MQTLFMYITDDADRILADISQEITHDYLQNYHLLKEEQALTLILMLISSIVMAFVAYAAIILVGKTIAQEQSKIY